MSLRLGRVAAVHPEDNSVDLVMVDNGERFAGVQVLSMTASTNCGVADLPEPSTPSGGKWSLSDRTDRDMIAVVGFVGRLPVVVGFLFPQINQMLFSDPNRRVMRHASDVYSTIDGEGNTEIYHPSGTFIRIGTDPDHEDLTGKDTDGNWAITKNTDKAVHVTLTVANGGSVKAKLHIDPDGNIVLEHSGDFSQKVGGSYTVESTGPATIKAPSITHDAPQTTSTGNQSVQGAMNVDGEGASGAVSTFSGTIQIVGGDVEADSISLKGHGHIEQGDGNRTGDAVP